MLNRNIYKVYKFCKTQARASITGSNILRHGKVATNQNAHHDRRRRIYKLHVHSSLMAKFFVLKMFECKRLQQDYIITTRHIECKLQVNPSRMAKFSILKMFEYIHIYIYIDENATRLHHHNTKAHRVRKLQVNPLY